MDWISILGLLVALAGILGGQILEGGHIGSLLQVTAFVIVSGGTLGAVMLQTPIRVFVKGGKMARWIFFPPAADPQRLVEDVVRWAQLARKEGLLALEQQIEILSDPFSKKGLQLLVDGLEPDKLQEALEVDIAAYEEEMRQGARIWEAAGGYAPTIGILGAVMGLIHIMENLTDPAKLGAGVAVAFVATIYGVGSANLLFLPIANKLKAVVARQVVLRQMLVDGLMGIASGENPRAIEARLVGYIV